MSEKFEQLKQKEKSFDQDSDYPAENKAGFSDLAKTERVCEICQSSEHATANHSERGESGVEFVAVEKLIPGINTKGLYDKNLGNDFKELSNGTAHRKEFVKYSDYLSRFFGYVWKNKKTEARNKNVFNRLKGQVLVDLGAGYGQEIYPVALEIGAKGYVGVDLWRSDDLKTALMERTYCDGFRSDKTECIPAVAVGEDILSFLKRLPDKSVSFTAFGLAHGILPEDYLKKMGKEIERALDPKGVMITDLGIGVDALYYEMRAEDKNSLEGRINHQFNVLVNLTEKQKLELSEILSEFLEKIKNMDKEELDDAINDIRSEFRSDKVKNSEDEINFLFRNHIRFKKRWLISKREQEIL